MGVRCRSAYEVSVTCDSYGIVGDAPIINRGRIE